MEVNLEKTKIIKDFINSSYIDLHVFLDDKKSLIVFEDDEIFQINEQKSYIDKIKSKQWTKNQHYVPQFYLKKFCNKDGRIETLDKENNRLLSPQNAGKICSDIYFYSMQTGKEDIVSQLLEDLFCYYENNFSEIYDELVLNILNNSEVDDIYLRGLCFFVVTTRMRGKYFREQMISDNINLLKDINYVDFSEDIYVNNIFHIKFISDQSNIDGFSNLLFNKKIRIYISNGERNFITSDNCIAELIPERQCIYGVGFMERFHYFVLSPKILIEFSDPKMPGKKIKRKRISGNKVIWFNLLRSMFGKYLYSSSKEDLIEEEYTRCRMNYIDDIFSLFPSQYKDEKKLMDYYKLMAEKHSIKYIDNYDLINKISNDGTKIN